jgi:hypothetical protein
VLVAIVAFLLVAVVAATVPAVLALRGQLEEGELLAALVIAAVALLVAAGLAAVELREEVKAGAVERATTATTAKEIPATEKAMEAPTEKESKP